MILLLSESDVAGILSMSDGVRVVEEALRQHARGGSTAMPRVSAEVPGSGGAFRVMSAILPAMGFFGLKTLTGYPGRRVAGETYFVVLLFDCDNGALRAMMAGNRLTGIRTGAATGVAAKYLSRPQSRVLGVIGAGVQARYQVSAVKEVRPVTEVRVFDVDGDRAEVFAQEIELDLEIRARAVRHARQAVAGCDLVVTVTSAKTPVLDGDWLEDGTHLSGVGSNTPTKRELDAESFRKSRIIVDFAEQALQEAGDLQDALRKGAIDEGAIAAELGEVITGKKAGRQDDRQITLFKSVGMAIEDIATATFVYQQALAAGVGTQVQLDPGMEAPRERFRAAVAPGNPVGELDGVQKEGPMFRFDCRLFLVVVLGAIVAAELTEARQAGGSALQGHVIDEQQAFLPGVAIVITNETDGTFRETVSGPDGAYFVPALVPGRYRIAADLTGFKRLTRTDVVLILGSTQTVDLKLEVGGIQENVTVSGEAPPVDLTSSRVGGNVASREILELPSPTRNFISFVAMLPGVQLNPSAEGSDSISVNGQSNAQVTYVLDGGNNTDDNSASPSGGQARTPLEVVEEFQIQTNQFDVEFGRTTGGVVNAITKRGATCSEVRRSAT